MLNDLSTELQILVLENNEDLCGEIDVRAIPEALEEVLVKNTKIEVIGRELPTADTLWPPL